MCDIEKEINVLLIKKDKLWEKQMDGYRTGSNTRARTTSLNARISNINDRIHILRKVLKNKVS